ncbi:hypothetical protein PPERSA_03508 [Pseudocohnilembus persalinus]|uniref:Uncharacterized protein n=1 Tax=Pseudocohnilembus persalinus TaxID=266149 RepID=A0A0V0R2L6_PSEPJ|nr:hypothetical protein PPERSA_03508 [Pseudocohnilembus persalinus]|eukprot:KRX08637.1 hypothetical protein PPERSA_03508 [Pseudocohnilembus persalinus]
MSAKNLNKNTIPQNDQNFIKKFDVSLQKQQKMASLESSQRFSQQNDIQIQQNDYQNGDQNLKLSEKNQINTYLKGGNCEQIINSDQCILQKIQDNLIAEPIKQLQDQQEEEESQQIDLKIEEETFEEKIDKTEYQNTNIQLLDQQRIEKPIQKEDNMYSKLKIEEINKENPNNSQNQVIDKYEQNVIYTMDFQKSIQKEQQLITDELQSTQIPNYIDQLQNNINVVNSPEKINQNISHQSHPEKQVYQKSINIKEEENLNPPQQIEQEQDILNKKSQEFKKPKLQDKSIKPFINLEDPNSIETIYVQGSIYDYVEVKNRKGQVSYMPKRISARQNRRKNQNQI